MGGGREKEGGPTRAAGPEFQQVTLDEKRKENMDGTYAYWNIVFFDNPFFNNISL